MKTLDARQEIHNMILDQALSDRGVINDLIEAHLDQMTPSEINQEFIDTFFTEDDKGNFTDWTEI